MKSPIYITKPKLPPLQVVIKLIEEIWDSKVLINSGPFSKKIEIGLAKYSEWINLKPVFVDADNTHNYGIAGKIDELFIIFKRYKVPLIYDSVSAFLIFLVLYVDK